MALYHLHVKNISRSHGRSAVAAAAYRAGATLENAAEEKLSAFAGRRDVLMAEIHLPENAPAWMADRQALWNAVEAGERRKDARLAKEVEFSIPRELARSAWLEVAREMAQHFTAQGFVVDLAVHDDGTGHNPHAHLMLATRTVTVDGFGPKLRSADRKTFLKDTRTAWQGIANAALAKAGLAVKIDASSYAARGIQREPGMHHAPDPAARRQRRTEVAAMVRDSDIARAITALENDPTARERYPRLTQEASWPPRTQAAPTVLDTPLRQEERAYWHEVHSRALAGQSQDRGTVEPLSEEAQPSAAADRERAQPAAPHDAAAMTLWEKMQRALLVSPEERRQLEIENAREAQRLNERVQASLVQKGEFSREGARIYSMILASQRSGEFERLLIEADRIAAKRQERGVMPEATPAQKREIAALEQAEQERVGVEFKREPAAQPPRPEVERETPAPEPRSRVTDPEQQARFALLGERFRASQGPRSPTIEPNRERAVEAQPTASPPRYVARPGSMLSRVVTERQQMPPDPFNRPRPAPQEQAPEENDTRERNRSREWER